MLLNTLKLNNKIKIYIIIIYIFYFFINYENIIELKTLNQNNIDINIIIEIIEKFLDSNNKLILNETEKIISKYWNEKPLCPFSKLISHGLTKEEAFLIIDFFQIESIEDLEKLQTFIKNNNL